MNSAKFFLSSLLFCFCIVFLTSCGSKYTPVYIEYCDEKYDLVQVILEENSHTEVTDETKYWKEYSTVDFKIFFNHKNPIRIFGFDRSEVVGLTETSPNVVNARKLFDLLEKTDAKRLKFLIEQRTNGDRLLEEVSIDDTIAWQAKDSW